MKYLTIEQIKHQCVIDEAFTEDDEYLEALGDTAEEMVERQVNQSLDDIYSSNGYMPAPIIHAMKLMVEYLYANRGGEDVQIPQAFYYMCSLYRAYT